MQVLWGDALLRVEEGLNAGRRWLWDEASRKAGTLIAAPSAFQGEHFLQVPRLPCCSAPASATTLTNGKTHHSVLCLIHQSSWTGVMLGWLRCGCRCGSGRTMVV